MNHAKRLLALTLCSIALSSTFTPPAFAQATPDRRQIDLAQSHFRRGVELFEEQDYTSALVEFRRAYETAPNWRVLYNIGNTCFQVNDYACALKAFEKYLAEGGSEIAATRKADVERDVGKLRARVARLTVTTNVPGAEVFVDEVSVGQTPLEAPVLVSAGRRKVTATYQGRSSAQRVVDVAGGDAVAVQLDLQAPEPARSPVVAQAPAPLPPATRRPSMAPAYIGLGVGGVGLGIGAAFGVAAMNGKSDLDKVCSTKAACPPSSQSQIDSLSRNATISTFGFVVGGVGAATALIYWIATSGSGVEAQPQPQDTPSARLRVTPWIGPTSAGVAGSF